MEVQCWLREGAPRERDRPGVAFSLFHQKVTDLLAVYKPILA